ncbi:GNAT family N-acetyltransferase [Natronomonas halophila]|uniref:GNAT family N-acetyltransferase n=1 Tax=Natronomonas halophila TaxID=2747817 RepID=UPI0015B73094|nr:GNAT family N-acetyltransferase [Natronomonas halophila]QLD84333.1 GNAT family N-acetyltransferase [Natronomonas halophila]
MQFSDELEFSHRDRKDIYEYIERYGTVDYEEARRSLDMSPEAFGHHVAVLRRDGIITRTDDEELRVAFEDESEETYVDEGLEVTIRQAREDDLTGLVGAIREAISDKTYIEGETVADIVESENVLLRHNELQKRVFFVATVHGDVVGWVHINAPEVEKLEHTAELTVGVIDEYRGHGIGSKLLDHGVDWALDNNFEKLYNSVPSTNEDAIEFLESRGWETEATRKKHYKIGDEYVDEVMMAKMLA